MAVPANLCSPGTSDGMTQVAGSMEPEVVFPLQSGAAPRVEGPEVRLMIAVLHDAVDCLTNDRLTAREGGKLLFRETRRWFLTDDLRGVFSFERICEFLDLDADAVRRRLGLAPRIRARPGLGRRGRASKEWCRESDCDVRAKLDEKP